MTDGLHPACDMQTQVKVALAGGGGVDDSRLLDEVFATWIGSHGKLLYWPIALRGIRPFQSCLEWITTTFAPLNITQMYPLRRARSYGYPSVARSLWSQPRVMRPMTGDEGQLAGSRRSNQRISWMTECSSVSTSGSTPGVAVPPITWHR